MGGYIAGRVRARGNLCCRLPRWQRHIASLRCPVRGWWLMLCRCARGPFSRALLRRSAASKAGGGPCTADQHEAMADTRTVPEGCAGRIVTSHVRTRAHAVPRLPGWTHNDMSSLSSYSVLKEGKGEVLQRANDVFYNKAQVRACALALQEAWCAGLGKQTIALVTAAFTTAFA